MYYVICTYICEHGIIHLISLSHFLLLSVNHLFVQLQAFKVSNILRGVIKKLFSSSISMQLKFICISVDKLFDFILNE